MLLIAKPSISIRAMALPWRTVSHSQVGYQKNMALWSSNVIHLKRESSGILPHQSPRLQVLTGKLGHPQRVTPS